MPEYENKPAQWCNQHSKHTQKCINTHKMFNARAKSLFKKRVKTFREICCIRTMYCGFKYCFTQWLLNTFLRIPIKYNMDIRTHRSTTSQLGFWVIARLVTLCAFPFPQTHNNPTNTHTTHPIQPAL